MTAPNALASPNAPATTAPPREGPVASRAEQQDREAEHADRQRAEDRRGDRPARARKRQHRLVALQALGGLH